MGEKPDIRLCAHLGHSAAFCRCSEADIGSGQITCPACAKNSPSRESGKEADAGKTSGPCRRPADSSFYTDTDFWLCLYDHNHLRITRILAALRELLGDGSAEAFHALV